MQIRPAPPPPAPAPPPPIARAIQAPPAPPPPALAPARRPEATCDVECYIDYFLVKFKVLATGQYVAFEAWPGQSLDIEGVRQMFMVYTLYGFNFLGYDLPMISLALTGVSCEILKAASNRIIQERMKPWEFYREYRLREGGPFGCDVVDLMEVAPGVGISLKMYAGRMHSRRMQDLPIHEAASIAPEQRSVISDYCANDLDVTEDLLNGLKDRVALRETVSGRIRVDVRSKSDAQLAEAWIASALGFRPQKATWPHGSTFTYVPPVYIQYQTEQLQGVLQIVRDTVFRVNDSATRAWDAEEAGADGVQLPATLDGRLITMGATTYKMGIGGLHSQESKLIARSDAEATIENSDVGSYYPSLILQLGLFPKSIGVRFLEIYRDIYDQRINAKGLAKKLGVLLKDAGLPADEIERLKREFRDAKTLESGFKIVLNGCYGKLGSKYSFLFAPDLMIAVTLTGQLALLMLAERFELAGIPVISANTDGIVCRVPRALKDTHTAIVQQWERDTSLKMDTDEWAWLYARDVNNYVAMGADGKLKVKGAYGLSGLTGSDMVSISGKHPSTDICVKAVHAQLSKGIPVEETVRASRDIRDFVAIQRVTGGAEYGRVSIAVDKAKKAERVATLTLLGWTEHETGHWSKDPFADQPEWLENDKAYKQACRESAIPGQYLGKAIRWIYSLNGKAIHNMKGNKVASTDGARPLMELPDEMPNDVNYQWYIDEARSMLADLGINP